jgi:hypothetical protein
MASAATEIDLLIDSLVIEPTGWNKLLSLRNKIEIPFQDIVSVEHDHRLAENGPVGIRFPGSNIPGVYLAGTFWRFWGDRKVRSFWIRRHAEKCITFHLRDHHFDYVTVEVGDPEAEIRLITTALRERGIILPSSSTL